MDDREVLQHLLEIENQAAALVDDAQAEADRRVSEGEKQNRARYDEIHKAEVKTLEVVFAESVAVIKENYRKQLEEYHESLKNMPLDTGAFLSLAERFLIFGKQ